MCRTNEDNRNFQIIEIFSLLVISVADRFLAVDARFLGQDLLSGSWGSGSWDKSCRQVSEAPERRCSLVSEDWGRNCC